MLCTKPRILRRRSDWLCFIDADTFLAPEALASCYAKAVETNADLFTMMTFQVTVTFWERVVLPLVMTALSVGFSPRKVNDPKRKDAIANGQFIFIKRSVYDAIGGHESVKDQIVEDKAISEKVKWSGYRLIVADGMKVAAHAHVHVAGGDVGRLDEKYLSRFARASWLDGAGRVRCVGHGHCRAGSSALASAWIDLVFSQRRMDGNQYHSSKH